MVRSIAEFNTIDFDGSHCFLCCEPLNDDNRTDEHIFPKWLQRKHDLWDQKIKLLNGTLISYKKLVIPCCSNCNNGPLSALEMHAKAAFSKQPDQLVEEDEKWLYLWAGKILFGLLAKERGLLDNRADPKSGTIIERTELDRLRAIHCHLQAIRFKHQFIGPNCNIPGSIVVIDSLESSNIKRNFDFGDDFVAFSLFLRTGNRTLFANFDGGLVAASIGHLMRKEAQKPLHPLQIKELWVKFMYKTQLVAVVPFFLNRYDEQARKLAIYIMSYDDADNLSQMAVIEHGQFATFAPIAPKERKGELFRDWNESDYGYRLAALVGVDPEEVFLDDEMTKVGTYLFNDDGTFREMPFD